MIQTVTGKIKKEDVGFTLGHEHLILNLSHIRNEDDSILNDVKLMVDELELAVECGLKTVVDVSNMGMGRDIVKLRKISELTKINVIGSTGFYQQSYYPKNIKKLSEEDIKDIFIKEIQVGIDESNIKAGVLAEIGSSYDKITDDEYKVFIGAAKAQQKTGVGIMTHCEQGTMALEQCDLLLSNGVPTDKIVIGHMDLVQNINYLMEVLNKEVTIAFDTIGKIGYVPDERRAEYISILLNKGYEDKIILSLDITRKSYLKKFGGHGYDYMFTTFIPLLKSKNVTNKQIKKILSDNMANILDIV